MRAKFFSIEHPKYGEIVAELPGWMPFYDEMTNAEVGEAIGRLIAVGLAEYLNMKDAI